MAEREVSLWRLSAFLGVIGAVCLLGIGGCLYAVPQYRVYSQEMTGLAKLRGAEHEKKVMIEQARAEVEAAKLRAEAIRIVGEATQEHPEYRLQEFIGAFADAMQNDSIDKIIYVPTEANIPIIEARGERE